jgi:hypothetical protein
VAVRRFRETVVYALKSLRELELGKTSLATTIRWRKLVRLQHLLFMCEITDRYFRPTIAHPEGSVCHYGDCHFFGGDVCTCGLLQDLAWKEDPDLLFPPFYSQHARHQGRLRQMLKIESDYKEPTEGDFRVCQEMMARFM